MPTLGLSPAPVTVRLCPVPVALLGSSVIAAPPEVAASLTWPGLLTIRKYVVPSVRPPIAVPPPEW